jgi:hypothetical protein
MKLAQYIGNKVTSGSTSGVNSALRLVNPDMNLRLSSKSTPDKIIVTGARTSSSTTNSEGDQTGRSVHRFYFTITASMGAAPAVAFSLKSGLTNEEQSTIMARLGSEIIEREGSVSLNRLSLEYDSLRNQLRETGLYCMTTRDDDTNAKYMDAIIRAYSEGAKLQVANATVGEFSDVTKIPISFIGRVFKEVTPEAAA